MDLKEGLCIINGNKDLWREWGGLLQRGAYEILMTPPAMKEYIENKSRLEDGTQVLTGNPKVQERSFSLSIKIRGNNRAQYLERYKSFIDEIQKGKITLKVPALKTVYTLVYDGCSKFGNQGRNAGLFSVKFREPNPKNRIEL